MSHPLSRVVTDNILPCQFIGVIVSFESSSSRLSSQRHETMETDETPDMKSIATFPVTSKLICAIASTVIWLVIGNAHKNNVCLQNLTFVPNLSTLLIMNGCIGAVNVVAILVDLFTLVFLSNGMYIIANYRSTVPKIMWTDLGSLLTIAWSFVALVAIAAVNKNCKGEQCCKNKQWAALCTHMIEAMALNYYPSVICERAWKKKIDDVHTDFSKEHAKNQ